MSVVALDLFGTLIDGVPVVGILMVLWMRGQQEHEPGLIIRLIPWGIWNYVVLQRF